MPATTTNPSVVIITDAPGWHGDQLAEALANHNITARYVSSTACSLNILQSGLRLGLPGVDDLPLAVFVRGLPGGSLEQVISRLNILHALTETGITVYNNPRGIERAVDKAMTSLLLRMAGLATPDTWVCESKEQAGHICRQARKQGKRLLMKPLFGSQGNGIRLLDGDTRPLPGESLNGVYYLQSFIDCGSDDPFDIRVFVIKSKAVSGMIRRNKLWLTNCAQGAQCQRLSLDKDLCTLAEAAVASVGIEYGGVDLIPDVQGKLHVIEVNSMPAWFELQKLTDYNIASRLISDMIDRLG